MKAYTYLNNAPITKSCRNPHAVYDGHFSPCCEGTPTEVISFLEEVRKGVNQSEESLVWEGHNGFYYQGAAAIEIIDKEISGLKNGNHVCFFKES